MDKKTLFHQKRLTEIEQREIMMSVINILQEKGLSYHQAIELLNDTKEQIGNISININRQLL